MGFRSQTSDWLTIRSPTFPNEQLEGLSLAAPLLDWGHQQTRSVRPRMVRRTAMDNVRLRLESDRFRRGHNLVNRPRAVLRERPLSGRLAPFVRTPSPEAGVVRRANAQDQAIERQFKRHEAAHPRLDCRSRVGVLLLQLGSRVAQSSDVCGARDGYPQGEPACCPGSCVCAVGGRDERSAIFRLVAAHGRSQADS